MLKLIKKLFAKKPKPHVCKFETYMVTGQGPTTAYVQRCKCGKEKVKHSGGKFAL